MKLWRRVKQRLRERLSLSSKIRLRRLFAGAVGPFRKAEQYSLKAPEIKRWDASDLLVVKNTLSGKRPSAKHEGGVQSSIIIPVFNKVDFTFQCLRSLLAEIDFSTTEIIVVNNASTDETSQVLAHFGDFVRVLDNQKNQGFVDACNQGAAVARGEYLVFLNNDTVVQPGWLNHLIDTIANDPSVGAVGSLFLYPDGTIQEAGAIVWKTGEAHHYGWGQSAADRQFNFVREVDYCSAASLLVRKSLFDKLGGFDRRYAPAYYEDVDLCFGVRSLGQKVIFQPLSQVIHYEGVTAGRDTAVGVKHYQIVNRDKFFEKWREVLEREHFPNDPSLAQEASNRKRGPRIIIFDDRVPTPDRDAGSARMSNILKSLARIGRPVFVPMKPLPEYEALLWAQGIETANIVEYRRLLKKRKFKVAVLSRPEVATALLGSIRRADRKIKIIFDMVDVYFIRLSREYQITGDHSRAKESQRFEDLEVKLARASDQVWCNSSEDKKGVSKYVAEERIVVIPTIHALHDRGAPYEKREGLLFIGHLRHRPNSDAVHYFMRDIYPLIIKSQPAVNFYIVGSDASPEILAYNSTQVHVLGHVPDLDPLVQSARVFVAPLRFGAGTKGKIGDAMGYGLPVVTTAIGAEGFGLTPGEDVMIAADPQEFAESVLRVYRDKDLWQQLADRAYSHIEIHFTLQTVGQTIKAGLVRLGALDQ